MSDAVAAPSSVDALPFEQALFVRSPFNLFTTTVLVFAALLGSFFALATYDQVPTILHTRSGFAFSDAAWPALVLSLLCSAALGMQRYVRAAEARDASDYARILSGGMASAANLTSPTASEARFGGATLIGIAVGLVIAVIIRVSEFREGHIIPPLTMGWYAAATIFLLVLFMRGVEQTRAGGRATARLLDAELKIDLMRTDTLAVLGRSAARSALVWFVISGIACLFFVHGDLDWLTVLLVLSCAVMGLGMFVSTMTRIHRQIVAAKAVELEHVRCRIDALRASLHEDAFASAALHGLLAYEKRVSDAPEWPFDQTTAVRVGASALILTVPWFGQAIAAYVVEHLGHIG